jgi:ABC-2 type transport system permease protein
MILAGIAVVAVILALPVALAVWLRRRWDVPWALFFAGCASFLGSQVVHIPLLHVLGLSGPLGPEASVGVALSLGLLAGLCEESARAVVLQRMPGRRTTVDAVMLGLGHGGIEAMLLGGVGLAAGLASMLAARHGQLAALEVPAPTVLRLLAQLQALETSPALIVMPLVERVLAMALQVAMSLFVMRAFRRRGWFLVAVATHTVADGLAVWELGRISVPAVEGTLAAVVLVAWALASRFGIEGERAERSGASAWRLLPVAARKELRDVWRTGRVFAVGAVMFTAGTLAPLLARFGPALVEHLVAGKGVTAQLPPPSAAEALVQWVKQSSQLGYLVVLLVGMGLVATEKERGTAALLFCRPLPRTTFVIAKWLALMALVTSGTAVAAVVGAVYAAVLFDTFDGVAWLGALGCLTAWLIAYGSVALLASALVRSLAAAAATGVALSIGMAILGAVPGFGQVMPGVLLARATALATGKAAAPVGGALAMVAVVAILSVLGGAARLEREEL